jgi:hypothetical protein
MGFQEDEDMKLKQIYRQLAAFSMMLLLHCPVASAEGIRNLELYKLLSAKKATVYIYTATEYRNMSEENFYKGSCIYETEDSNGIRALVGILNFSNLKESPGPRPYQEDRSM